MMERWHVVKRLLPLLSGFILFLSACGRPDLSTLHPQGPVAAKQFQLMVLAIIIMTVVVVIVFGIAIYVIIRYRRRVGQDKIPLQVEGNHKLEIIWTVIPMVLLLILAIPTLKYVFELAEDYSSDPNAIHVKVTGHQFWWEFEYTDFGIITAHDLVIPQGKKIALDLGALDVLHSFWVPSLAGKIDTHRQVDGKRNKMFIEASGEGVYRGKCAELCGQSHALMEFKVKSVNEATFQAWVAEMKAEPKAFEGSAAAAESFKQNCLTCHALDNDPALGPNLKGTGSRETVAGIMLNRETIDEPIHQTLVEQHLRQWIMEPQKIKPGNQMPAFKDQLSPEQLDGIVKYLAEYKLESLKEINKQ